MDRREHAVALKHGGCNCTQAVLCAFAEGSGLSEDALMRIGATFCAGMGCMEATCGALIAAEMLLGLKRYDGKPMLGEARAMYRAFEETCGATICRDLKGRDTGRVICECDDCVRCAVSLVERFCL